VLTTHNKFGISFTCLIPISELYNTHSDILYKKNNLDIAAKLVDAILTLRPSWELFRINNLLETDQALIDLHSILARRGGGYLIKSTEPSFFIKLPDTFERYLAERSKKFRNHLRRMGKKMDGTGKVDFLSRENFHDFNSAYEAVLKIESLSWKNSHGTAISSIKRQENFYKQLLENIDNKQNSHLFYLYMDNEPIAYNMGIIKDDTYYYLKTSFIEEYRRLSPSTVLRAKLIETLIEKKIKYFDFPGEPYEWESQWANDLRWHRSIIIFNKSSKSRLLSFFYSVKNLIKPVTKERKVHFHNPLDTTAN